MSLIELNIHNVRNIVSASLPLHERYNFICGTNGSGKTSLLESLYLLSHGRSFRSRQATPLINEHADTLSVFARKSDNSSVSIQKSSNGLTQVRLNQEACRRCSELANFLPCQLFYADIFQIIDAGPAIRRGVLDWGLFHVKQSSYPGGTALSPDNTGFDIHNDNKPNNNYHEIWTQYRLVLKHRNALLRQQAPTSMFQVWDEQLATIAEQLDEMRLTYYIQWEQAFNIFLAKLTNVHCEIHYFKGWDKKESGKSLLRILEEQLPSDRQRLYTQSGAHQADIVFKLPNLNSKQTLSRGQQKIILIALKFAQAHLLSTPCLYLLDDLTAELDAEHVARVMGCLELIQGQFFLTTIDEIKAKEWSDMYSSNLFDMNSRNFIKFKV